MPRLEEAKTDWRYLVVDVGRFERLKVKDLGKGVKIALGNVKGSGRWEIQSYLFAKELFKTREQVRKWLDTHLKGEIQTLLDFRAWNEYRRRVVNAYVQISNVE